MSNDRGITCAKHPHYKAIRKPKSGCRICWYLFKTAHPDWRPGKKDKVKEPCAPKS